MKKSTLFLLTLQATFVVIAVAAAITIYHFNQENNALVTDTATSSPTLVVAANNLTPEQAAQVAAQSLGRSDLYKVEFAILNGVNAYKVTFSSGEWVYTSSDGEILPVVISQGSTQSGSGN